MSAGHPPLSPTDRPWESSGSHLVRDEPGSTPPPSPLKRASRFVLPTLAIRKGPELPRTAILCFCDREPCQEELGLVPLGPIAPSLQIPRVAGFVTALIISVSISVPSTEYLIRSGKHPARRSHWFFLETINQREKLNETAWD